MLQSCQDGATTSLVLTTNQESQCVLFNDQIRCRQWGSNPGALDSEPDALHHRAPLASTGTECRQKNNIYKAIFFLHFSSNSSYKSSFYLEKTLDPFIRLMKVLNKSLINLLVYSAQNDHCIGILSMFKHRHANNTPGGDSLSLTAKQKKQTNKKKKQTKKKNMRFCSNG